MKARCQSKVLRGVVIGCFGAHIAKDGVALVGLKIAQFWPDRFNNSLVVYDEC